MKPDTDTIAAIASAVGRGAIAVVRLSGKEAFPIFSRLIDREAAEKLEARRAQLLRLFFPDGALDRYGLDFVDDCIVVPYVAPDSYTGEDLIEIFCHGGSLVPNLVLESLIHAGARLAKPGEFTLRAFLNGKMDLAQAESIEYIVSSRTAAELRLAHHHYSGRFSSEIRQLRSELIDLLSLLELELDFSDEDVEFASREELMQRLHSLEELLMRLVRSFERSHLVREGIYVAIVGKPNVGKSSLLNLVLKKERAIVTDIPGTTRDVIEEAVDISGYKFVLVDTAGIRDADDVVEQEGVRRSESVLEQAPLVLFLVDQHAHLQKEDWEVRQRMLQHGGLSEKKIILILNKNDLDSVLTDAEIEQIGAGFERVRMSCRTGEGLDKLEAILIRTAKELLGETEEIQAVLGSLRQKEAAQRALEALQDALRHFQEGLSQEFVAADLRVATDALGELIGVVTTEDILGNIFSHFCIGK